MTTSFTASWTLVFVVVMQIFGQIAAGCVDGPLGMSNGEIKDWQISASSTYPPMWDANCHEKYARLYLDNEKAWCAKHRSDSEWLQIDLGVAAKITGVIVQGRPGKQEWVTSFMVSYSVDAFQWQFITDKYGNQKLFQGNEDDHTIKHNYFDQSIRARFIKFHTVQWQRHPSMRVEILGCQECKQLLGTPPYGRLKASSILPLRNKHSCQPSDGFALSNKGWCPRKKTTNDQWLELDIGHPTLVTALVTRGRGDTDKNHWVTKYKVSYSNDSLAWSFYKDANHLEPKQFGGNADKQMERIHYLNNPFWARFVRFYPIQWNEHIGLRAGVYGCPFTAACLPGYFRVNENSNCVENLAYQKEVWTNERKPSESLFNKNRPRSFMSLLQEGHPSLAVDGNDDNALHKCAIMDNYYAERPTLVINLGRVTNVAGLVIKSWQGKGQDSNFAYRDYMYGLDRFSVFVDKRPFNSHHINSIGQNPLFMQQQQQQLKQQQAPHQTVVASNNLSSIAAALASGTNATLLRSGAAVAAGGGTGSSGGVASSLAAFNLNSNVGGASSGGGSNGGPKLKLNEQNLCNFVTRNNYAIFTPQIHMQCNKPLQGRYLYIQADGRSNRWSRLFSAVLCEIQVYEL